jgi:hypothetical protein
MKWSTVSVMNLEVYGMKHAWQGWGKAENTFGEESWSPGGTELNTCEQKQDITIVVQTHSIN